MSNAERNFITTIYNKITISELRLILRTKGSIDLWYNVYDDVITGPSLIWNITKVGKEYKLTRYLSADGLYKYKLIKNRTYYENNWLSKYISSNNLYNDQLDNRSSKQTYREITNLKEIPEIPEEIYGSLKEVLSYINFTKAFKVVKELINIDNITIDQLVGDSNLKNLPFNKYYRDENYSFEYYQNKIIKWYQEDYFRVFKHALDYLGIGYKPDKYGITWWYLGQKFVSKVDSFGQIGYGVCYRLNTIAIEKHKFGNLQGEIKTIRWNDVKSSTSWIVSELINCILAVNILKNKKVYNSAVKYKEFNNLGDISTKLINKRVLHAGDPTYVEDSVFDGHDDKQRWIGRSKYLKSQFPDIKIICKEAKNCLLELDKNIISKLEAIGIKNAILGYYGFREMYVHPDPYKHSSMICWRFNNPITINIETGEVEYHHLHNNEKLWYPRIKIHDKELLIEAYQNILVDYCYRIPLDGI